MNTFEIIFIALSVCADVFAISLCIGAENNEINTKNKLFCAFLFAGFQTITPLVGFALGSAFAKNIAAYGDYIAFLILFILGIKMIIDSFNAVQQLKLKFTKLFWLAFATSIDALSVGFGFSLLSVNMFIFEIFDFIFTFLACFFGICIGWRFGEKNKKSSRIIGGIVLIIMAIKILIEHFL